MYEFVYICYDCDDEDGVVVDGDDDDDDDDTDDDGDDATYEKLDTNVVTPFWRWKTE